MIEIGPDLAKAVIFVALFAAAAFIVWCMR